MPRVSLSEIENVSVPDLIRENFIAKAAFGSAGESDTRVDCGLPSDTFNVAVPRVLDHGKIPAFVKETLAYFRAKHYPMAFWLFPSPTRAQLALELERAGLIHTETDVAMIADLETLPEAFPPEPRGFEIEEVRTLFQMVEFSDILSALFGESPEAAQVRRYYRRLSLKSDEMRFYLGRFEGFAVSTGVLFLDGTCAGIYDLSTLVTDRRQGFGSAMFRFLLGEARQSGYRTAVLQASPDGFGIYERDGFRRVADVLVYENRELFEEG